MKKQPKPRCAKCKVNQAAAADAQRQLNEATAALNNKLHYIKFLWEMRRFANLAAELNMQAYEDAQMHARTNHKLLTEAKEEIERLTDKVIALQDERDNRHAENDCLSVEVGTLRQAVEFSDMQRRMAERDRDHYKAESATQAEAILRQQNLLKQWGRFDVVSSQLGGDHV
jgi:hypothetical protein